MINIDTRTLVTQFVSQARVLLIVGVLFYAPGCERAGEELVITEGSCGTCKVRVDPVAIIGSDRDSVGLSGFSVSAWRPPEYIVSPTSIPGVITTYSSDGHFLKTVGRVGSGPGEFRGPTYVQVHGDTIHVIDLGLSRWTVVGPDGSTKRTTSIPLLGTTIALLNGGQMAFHGIPRDGPGNKKPLHIVAPDSKVTSFGPETSSDSSARYILAPARDGGLWTIQKTKYQVSKWSATGLLERTFSLKRPWFEYENTRGNSNAQEIINDRRTYSYSLREREDGLWVVMSVVRPSWNPPEKIAVDKNGFPEPRQLSRKFMGVIEVLDPASGTLRASTTIPSAVKFINDSLAYSFDSNNEEFRHRISKLSLSGRAFPLATIGKRSGQADPR